MARFIARRLIAMVLVMFAVSVLVFLIFNVIPNGDPAARMAGKNSTPQQIEAIRRDWGFDDSLPQQYLTTMGKVFTGDLVSYANREDVMERIIDGAPRTFVLAIGAAIIWFVSGVALGLFSAMKAGRVSDRLVTVLALIGISMPVFWVGALMNYYLGYKLGIFPNGGYVPISQGGVFDWLYHLILPWIALSLLFIGVYSRVLRSSVLDTINDDYVRTARAKGLGEQIVVVAHVLRNALIPAVTLLGLSVGYLLGGTVIVERVFSLPGAGALVVDSIGARDYPGVQSMTLIFAILVILINLVTDVIYSFLDPRVRLG